MQQLFQVALRATLMVDHRYDKNLKGNDMAQLTDLSARSSVGFRLRDAGERCSRHFSGRVFMVDVSLGNVELSLDVNKKTFPPNVLCI